MTRFSKTLISGAAGGIAGSLVMNQFINFYQGSKKRSKPYERQSGGQKQKKKSTDRPASVQTADKLSQLFLKRKLRDKELKIAGPLLHLLFGASAGMVYGLIRSFRPEVSKGQGTIFGAALWLVADETLMPLAGVAKGPAEYDFENHFGSLAAHLVYGLTLESAFGLMEKKSGDHDEEP